MEALPEKGGEEMRGSGISRKAGLVGMMCFLLLSVHPLWAKQEQLLLATTTSTDNTGLLDYLAPQLARATGIRVKWVATGTGKALKLGENCDADVLMVHAPGAERDFVAAGFGVNRQEIMYNDFVFIGPDNDPAAIAKQGVCSALAKIQAADALFVSRGDNSGTNKKEISLWKSCGKTIPDRAGWYLQTGQGMLVTINVAAERRGYTLTDRGTYIKYAANHHGNPPLKILVEGDPDLVNQYSIIEVNPDRCPHVKNGLARRFGDWLTGSKGQAAIGNFRLLGKQLFTPNAGK